MLVQLVFIIPISRISVRKFLAGNRTLLVLFSREFIQFCCSLGNGDAISGNSSSEPQLGRFRRTLAASQIRKFGFSPKFRKAQFCDITV
jgi:hypothetical protein